MRWGLLIVCLLLNSACKKSDDKPKLPAIMAAASSVKYAEKDRVDFDHYTLNSVARLGYGDQSVVHKSMTSTYIESVRERLKTKRYWEACYGVYSDFEVGATYCYYLDEKNFSLLAVYRVK